MPQPGKPSASGEDWLVRKVQDLERELKELKAANVFGTTGIHPMDGGTEFDGYVNVNGNGTINGPLAVTGSMDVTGTANFTGNTTIGGTASVAGDITKTNSWGASSLGPVAFGTGAPGLTFTKAGTTYGKTVGIGLSRNSGGTLDQLILFGPGATDGAFLILQSNGSFTLGSDSANTTSQVYTDPGPNGSVNILGGRTNGSVYLQSYGTGNVQVNGNFAVSGTKAFIMDHPAHPGTMKLMHAATESPVNGVEYWGTVTLDAAGQATAALPGYFEALTKATGRNIQLTPIGRTSVQVSADRINAGAFTIYGAPGQEVDWLVKAERQHIVNGHDELSFPVEQDKLIIGPQLQGA